MAIKLKITSIRLKLDKRQREKDLCLGCRSRPDGILGCEGLKFKLSLGGRSHLSICRDSCRHQCPATACPRHQTEAETNCCNKQNNCATS